MYTRFLLLLLMALLFLAGISCQKEPTTSPEDVLLPKTFLFVDSNPRGSKIFIDNRYMGQRTPDTITWLEKGTHLVTLKQNLLKDSNLVVNITDEYSSVFFDYTTNPTMRGNLYCDSNPRGAEIYINDSNTALTTPKLIKGLFPAEYAVKYKLPGFWDSDEKVAVVSERTITVDTNLPDSTVWVNFNVANIGLPTNTYNDIGIEDGYIKWLASEGAGLIRYVTGKDFTVYNTENSPIPSNDIKSITVLGNEIWISTYKGAACLKNGNFTIYNSSNSPVPDSVDCIYPAPGGKVWIGSVHDGLFYFDGNGWTRYHMGNSPLGTNHIRSLFVDQISGIVWIGTLGEGLYLFDGSHWVRIFNALPSPLVDAIKVFGSEVYIGTSFHTRMFWNGQTFKSIFYKGGLAVLNTSWHKYKEAGSEIIALAIDNEGNLWFSDFPTSLGKKSAEGIKRYPGYNRINGIAIDGEGHKWMSTSIRGIVKFKGD